MKLLMVSPGDNVVVALEDISTGQVAIVLSDDRELIVVDNVPKGHKIAMLDMEKGECIIKGGVVIGVLYHGIKKGAHVHVHNLRSKYL